MRECVFYGFYPQWRYQIPKVCVSLLIRFRAIVLNLSCSGFPLKCLELVDAYKLTEKDFKVIYELTFGTLIFLLLYMDHFEILN